jgi:pimeloyl-ACP methyl ester carboxylesterase
MNASATLLFIALMLLVNGGSSISTVLSDTDEIRSYIEHQVGEAWEELEDKLNSLSSRRLLQNPDVPAITKYGGETMEALVPDGYPLEKHDAVTDDGWVLEMYRIPHGKYRNNKPGPRPVILLHHGITLSSACFALLNANESLAYIFADAGLDVWMANTRGNTFSRGNYQYSYRDVEYWYHTIDEYGLIDAPTQINKALEVSGAKKLAFVGHSQGSTVIYTTLAALPEMNEKVSVVMHMGPVAFLDFFRAPFLRAYGLVRNDQFLRDAAMGEFLWYRFLAPYVKDCQDYRWAELCGSSLNYMFYGPSIFITPDDFQVILKTWPASVSARNMAHWAQMLTDNRIRLQRFDFTSNCTDRTWFAETCNQQAYGTLIPPDYDLSRITVPQVLLSGQLDIMSVPEDVAEQVRRLKNALVYQKVYKQYSHMDFVWDRNARHAADIVEFTYRFSVGTF